MSLQAVEPLIVVTFPKPPDITGLVHRVILHLDVLDDHQPREIVAIKE